VTQYIEQIKPSLDGIDALTARPEPAVRYRRASAIKLRHLNDAVSAAHCIIQRRQRSLPVSRRKCCAGESMPNLVWRRGMAMLIASGAVSRTTGVREGYEFIGGAVVAYALIDELRKRTIVQINSGRDAGYLRGPLPSSAL